jgi:DMSO reductase anchor subunit
MTTTQNIEFPDSLRHISKPVHQKVWGLPAAVNFFLGGTAAGYYILWAVLAPAGSRHMHASALGGLPAAALVMTGFACLAFEAGRPLRARYLMAHLERSWMSREATAGCIFVAAAIFDAVTGVFIARWLSLAAACAFLFSQAMMLPRCTAIPFWRDPAVPLLFVSGGLAAGLSLWLFFSCGLSLFQCATSIRVSTLGIGILGLNFGAWVALLLRKRSADLQPVTGALSRPAKILVVVGIGQLLPMVLLLAAKPWALHVSSRTEGALMVVTAATILTGIWAQKLWLMHFAQHLCGLRMDS